MRALAIGVTTAFALTIGAHAQQTQAKTPPPTPAQSAAAPKAADAAKDVSGKWDVSVETDNGTYLSTLEIKVDAGKVAGTITSSDFGASPIKGEFADGKLKFVMTLDMQGTAIAINFEGKVQDNGSLAGTAAADQLGQMSWKAARAK